MNVYVNTSCTDDDSWLVDSESANKRKYSRKRRKNPIVISPLRFDSPEER